MIAADHFLLDGDHAWLVITQTQMEMESWHYHDSPCFNCEGQHDGTRDTYCPDCIDGRHTFDIEVEHPGPEGAHIASTDGTYRRVLRVHVVPGMVLRLTAFPMLIGSHISQFGDEWTYWPCTDDEPMIVDTPGGLQFTDNFHFVTLPPAAKPGMWAVKLAVHR